MAHQRTIATRVSSRPEEALSLVGLEKCLEHFPSQLSGCEQPSVLLCDEPTRALDSTTGILVLEALKNVNGTMNATTLLITHNAAVADMADRVVAFSDGQIREQCHLLPIVARRMMGH